MYLFFTVVGTELTVKMATGQQEKLQLSVVDFEKGVIRKLDIINIGLIGKDHFLSINMVGNDEFRISLQKKLLEQEFTEKFAQLGIKPQPPAMN